jgi:RNA polymerase sigma-70 factor (ECF subfamily)
VLLCNFKTGSASLPMPNVEEIIIIEGLKAGGMARRRFENALWQKFIGFINWAGSKYQLSKDDLRHAYDDTICSVIDNIVTGRYKEDTNALLKTYAEAIFHHKCLDRLPRTAGKEKRRISTDSQPISESLIDMLPSGLKNTIELMIEEEDRLKMQHCLDKLGDICREILKLFGGNYKDKEIAVMLNYSSSEVAKQSRYRCMEKLTETYISMYKHE